MSDSLKETMDGVEFRVSRPVAADFQAASDHAPPAPSQMFARLGFLLMIALAFGLVAQVLVGAPL